MHRFRHILRPSLRRSSLIRSKSSVEGHNNNADITKLCLSEPWQGLKVNESSLDANFESFAANEGTKVTTLSNGLRIASENKPGRFCTVGVIVDSGSRYESGFPSGVNHFLEKLAFGSTEKFSSRDEILSTFEKHGGICDCQITRDSALYAASVEVTGLEEAVEAIGEAVLRPNITQEEFEYARMAVNFDIEDANMRPDQEPLMAEAIHAAAFGSNTVGLPKMCPDESSLDPEIIRRYLKQYYTPDRIVLGAVGVDHQRVVDAAEKYLQFNQDAINSVQRSKPDKSLAQYTGGLITMDKDLSNVSLGPTPMPDLAHISIGVEGVSHQDKTDFVPLCVINQLMGGGGSFSAGGPGKGMYTRLYTNVLNRCHWMYSAQAFNHAYADSGVFCVTAAAPPDMLGRCALIVAEELTRLTGHIGKEEFDRAKKMLTSMLLMNLEARPVMFEDIVRQTLAQGTRKRPEHYIDLIEAIQVSDVNRVAEKMLASKPAVAAIGKLEHLPDYKDIELGLLRRENKAKSFTLFK